MGRITEFKHEEEDATTSPSLSEALLFTTMCIVGLPVEVHIKDGSIYSGIFHTACLDKGYGVALKKARMIRKGTHNANVPNGGLIDTLVVLPGDLVQVVAKSVMLPANGVSSTSTYDDVEAVSAVIDSFKENGALTAAERMDHERDVRVGRPRDEEDALQRDSDSLKEVLEVHSSGTSLNGSYTDLNVKKENHAMASNQLANGSPSSNDPSLKVKIINQFHDNRLSKEFICTEYVTSEVPQSFKPDLGATRGTLVPTDIAPPQNPLANRTAKESKLNPGAKVFSPSLPNLRSTPPLVPAVQSVAYVPNNIPPVQVPTPQPEVAIRPMAARSSWPVKFIPYVNSTPINADNSLQYGQPVSGHITTRVHPIRHGAQYQPIQAMPPYVHHSPQNGMYGRPGQVVYVHPVTHDVIQGPAALSQAPHPLLTSHPIHLAKHEGVLGGQALQVSMNPPLVTNVQQPFAMPSHIPQPLFSSMRPVPVLGSNIPYSAKFP